MSIRFSFTYNISISVVYKIKTNLNDNIKGGIMYYQMMYKKFGSMDLALAAYNAGPGNVAKYKGVPPFRETQRFVNTIKTNAKAYENDPLVIKHTKNKFSDEEIKKWLIVFLKRFFTQQFKRSCLPDGPKVGTVSLSPRGDLRMPSDASANIWLKKIKKL